MARGQALSSDLQPSAYNRRFYWLSFYCQLTADGIVFRGCIWTGWIEYLNRMHYLDTGGHAGHYLGSFLNCVSRVRVAPGSPNSALESNKSKDWQNEQAFDLSFDSQIPAETRGAVRCTGPAV